MDKITMVEVEELVARLAALESKAAALEEQAADLTNQIVQGLDLGASEETQTNWNSSRRAVQEERSDILEALPLLRSRIVEHRREACLADAEARMHGIGRAYKKFSRELDADEKAVLDLAAAYTAGVERLNERYRSLSLLKAEANALKDRFGIPAPAFASVVLPAMREGCREAAVMVSDAGFLDHAHISILMEKCPHGLRQRRTYEEIASTPGGEIIRASGVSEEPWPALTAQQEKIVDERLRQQGKAVATAAQFETEALRGAARSAL